MKKSTLKAKTLSIALLLGISTTTVLHAQEAATAAGGEASGSGGSVSYSVGQVAYASASGAGGSVAEGVEQPFISVVTSIEEASDINLSIFPNPTANLLTLSVGKFDTKDLQYQLFDMSGKLLATKKITNSTESISLLELAAATYFLRISNNTHPEVKTFKIIKN